MRTALQTRPPRGQAAAIVPIARALRDRLVAPGGDHAEADTALDLIGRWAGGEDVSGRAFSDAIYSDAERGVLRRLNDESDPAREMLWSALTTASAYVGWLAYRHSGELMPEDIAEVGEDTLDLLDEQWRDGSAFDPVLPPG